MPESTSPWKLGGLSVKELGVRVYQEATADEILDRGAALAYYLLFALFPGLLFLTTLLGLLPIPDLMERLLGYARQALPPDAASLVERTLGEIQAGARGGLLSIGVIGALWAGSAGMAAVMNALNVAYDVTEVRPFWRRRLVAVALTVGFAIFIITALVLMVFGPRIGEAVAGAFGLGGLFTALWNVISIPVVILLVLVGIALVYYLAPASKQQWRWVTPGSLTALVLWLALSFGLRLYVTSFGNYNATYGSIGGVILLLLWLYLSSVVILLGAEVNAEIEHAAAERGDRTAKPRAAHDAPAGNGARAPDEARAHRVGAVPARAWANGEPVGSVTDSVGRLVRLRVEMAWAEARGALVGAAVAAGVAVVAGIMLVASLLVLLAGAFAPLFDARVAPVLAGGGAAFVFSAAALAWSVVRIRGLRGPRQTVTALKEDWKWLGTRLRSRTTSSSPAASWSSRSR
jgi:membrane protein